MKNLSFMLTFCLALFCLTGCNLLKSQSSVEYERLFNNNFDAIIVAALERQNLSPEAQDIAYNILKDSIKETIISNLTANEIKEVNLIFSSPKFRRLVIKVLQNQELTSEERQLISNIQQISTGFQKFTSKELQIKIIENAVKALEEYRSCQATN